MAKSSPVRTVEVFSLLAAASLAQAQEFPVKPIRLIVGFAPGGAVDIIARHVAPRFGELIGQQVVVENRPGATGMIAAELVARAAPDGYVLNMASVSSLVLNPHVLPKVSVDALNDFTPVTMVGTTPLVVAVHPSLPTRSLKELFALAKAKPGALSFASPGVGGIQHLTIALLGVNGKVDIQHVAYKGTGPATIDLLGGHVHGAVAGLPGLIGYMKSGKLRALCIASDKRSPLAPEVPTSVEQGFPGLQATSWYGVIGPAKMPRPALDKVHATLVKASHSPDVVERFTGSGVEAQTFASAGAFADFVREEYSRWGKVVKQAGVSANR